MAEPLTLDDCWNRIGVWAKGGASCARLEAAVHCRNCDRYRAAGRELLRRDLAQGARLEAGKRYADRVRPAARQGTSFTVFRLGEEWLALPTGVIDRVSVPGTVRRIPHRSNRILRGLMNLGGEGLLVIALDVLLGIDATAPKRAESVEAGRAKPIPRLLVVQSDKGLWAFETDELAGTFRQDEARLGQVPSTLAAALVRHVRGTFQADGRLVGVLDFSLVIQGGEQALR